MPNPSKGARLYLRKRRSRESTWVIRDGGHEISTGCDAGDRDGAERQLARYIAGKYQAPTGQRDPSKARIADILSHYLRTHAPATSDPAREATAAIRLTEYPWHHASDIDRQSCAGYVRAREATVATGTARRELETLQAALRLAWKDKLLTTAPAVHLPPKSPPRDRWLTKDEADRAIAAAEALPKGGNHIATFLRIGLMTGTRRTAILTLQWQENLTGGYVDLANGMIYRRPRRLETKKRQPPIRIPDPLLPYLETQRQRTRQYVIEYRGQPVRDIRDGLKRAGEAAGVPGITPHVLRHTCCTWLAQDGVPIWEAAGLVGMSPNEFQRTYAHHHPDHMGGAQAAIGRRWE